MLLHLLIFTSIIYNGNCDISCYDCSKAPSKYNYLISSENIPVELQNCVITSSNHSRCYMDIRWYLTLNTTTIYLLPDNTGITTDNHELYVYTRMSGVDAVKQMQSSLYYDCSTDQCNNINTMKRLFECLTLVNYLDELEDLLQPSTTSFNGSWCLLANNQTNDHCPSPGSVDPRTCKQCATNVTSSLDVDQVCGTCLPDAIHQNALGEDIIFNMTNHRRTKSWFIYCQSENCSHLNTDRLIHENSLIDFDFDKFFDDNSGNQQKLSTFFLLLIIFVLLY